MCKFSCDYEAVAFGCTQVSCCLCEPSFLRLLTAFIPELVVTVGPNTDFYRRPWGRGQRTHESTLRKASALAPSQSNEKVKNKKAFILEGTTKLNIYFKHLVALLLLTYTGFLLLKTNLYFLSNFKK